MLNFWGFSGSPYMYPSHNRQRMIYSWMILAWAFLGLWCIILETGKVIMLYSYLVHYSVFSCTLYICSQMCSHKDSSWTFKRKYIFISRNVFVLRFDHKQNLWTWDQSYSWESKYSVLKKCIFQSYIYKKLLMYFSYIYIYIYIYIYCIYVRPWTTKPVIRLR